jgi:hypothetical protein
MHVARRQAAGVLLGSGAVLIVGGVDNTSQLSSCELFH